MFARMPVFIPMERKQSVMVAVGVIGVLGIQIALYELIKGITSPALLVVILLFGALLAYRGFSTYIEVEKKGL